MSERIGSTSKRASQRGDGTTATTYEFPYMRQPKKRTVGQFLYDHEKGKILGRTPKNWGNFLLEI
jgi:hypothetical protein